MVKLDEEDRERIEEIEDIPKDETHYDLQTMTYAIKDGRL